MVVVVTTEARRRASLRTTAHCRMSGSTVPQRRFLDAMAVVETAAMGEAIGTNPIIRIAIDHPATIGVVAAVDVAVAAGTTTEEDEEEMVVDEAAVGAGTGLRSTRTTFVSSVVGIRGRRMIVKGIRNEGFVACG